MHDEIVARIVADAQRFLLAARDGTVDHAALERIRTARALLDSTIHELDSRDEIADP